MNEGVKRFLSRRDKDGSGHRREKSKDKSSDRKARPRSGEGFTSLFKADPQKKVEQEQNNKLSNVRTKLQREGYENIGDDQISYALASKHANGDADKAFEMVVLFQQSVEGIVKPYDPAVHMLGAENRDNVTCYLDTLLFSMFSRLSSFEPILHTDFSDPPRQKLSMLIRLWVNMLRTGKLIQTDVTQRLQEALADCGWDPACSSQQQDTSEAFQAITDILQLPLLTLKVDLVHGGKDDTDDHKLINERLLNVAVPDPDEHGYPIKLEDCLENYFNNKVDVNRFLERTQSMASASSPVPSTTKGTSEHVEVTELTWSTPDTPTTPQTPSTPLTPAGRLRAPSLIQRRVIEENDEENGESEHQEEIEGVVVPRSTRKGSIRKEVLIPAWQFYHLIPWVTTNNDVQEAKIADHFQSTRPVLGVCLKRYTMTPEGIPIKKKTYIDIPLDLRLPHFVNDTHDDKDRPLEGQFKLSLQSVICHRGENINEGHYVAYIRGNTQAADGDSHSLRRQSNAEQPPGYSEDRWIKFDDFGNPRVQYTDISQALKNETPYLLFYQVQPIYDLSIVPPDNLKPPSYTDSGIGMSVTECSPTVPSEAQSQNPSGYFDGASDDPTPAIRLSTDIERHASPRMSLEVPDERRASLAQTEISVTSLASTASSIQVYSAPTTPSEETTGQRLSRAAASMAKFTNRSRPTSQSGDNRISATFSRLNIMGTKSREQLHKSDGSKENHTTPPDAPPLPNNGVPTASEYRRSITIDESSLRPTPESLQMTVANSSTNLMNIKIKKDKKRDKSKGPSEKTEGDHHHGHSRSHSHSRKDKGKGKSRDENKVPDRECTLM